MYTLSFYSSDGVVYLNAMSGTYLPVFGPELGELMSACIHLTADAAVATTRATALKVYSACGETGPTPYTPQANDTFTVSPKEYWSVNDENGHISLRGTRQLRLIVNPANYTPELLASGARCPRPNLGGYTIGFDISFDVQTGEIVSVKPGRLYRLLSRIT